MTDSKTRVLIVDDHPIVREGFADLISRQDDFLVCGEAGDAAEAREAVKRLRPDVVIVDLSLGTDSGLLLIRQIATEHPKVRTLALSMHDERVYARRALRAGAKGYVMKQRATKEVLSALRRIASGGTYFSGELAATSTEDSPGDSLVDDLSDRELEVFCLIGEGLKTSQIGERLHISAKTVESHRENIKLKLGLADALELTQSAIAWVHGERQI